MLFNKKRCPNCDKIVDKSWNFCSYCGNSLRGKPVSEDLEKEFRKLNKEFGFPKVFLKPERGITITISSGRPVEIKTRRIEPKVKKEFKPEVKRPLRIAKFTEEPETKIERLGNKQIIQIKLPEVKSQDDIEIDVFEQSIEIKAFAGDKGYFKLIPIPTNSEILRREFKNNILKLEVVK